MRYTCIGMKLNELYLHAKTDMDLTNNAGKVKIHLYKFHIGKKCIVQKVAKK